MQEGSAATVTRFADRAEAGRALADHLAQAPNLFAPVVIALPRGGVPVGAEVARRLGAPLLVMPVGKVGAPGQEELALGAVAPGGVTVLNDSVVAALGLGRDEVDRLVAQASARVAEQQRAYGGRPLAPLEGRSAIVVDDGLATGATMRAALVAVRRLQPAQLVLAVPVAPPSVLLALAPLADAQVCLRQPPRMQAVGSWYRDFTQTSGREVTDLLRELGPG